MQLGKKKAMAARILGVGKDRVIFVESRLKEIKEAITRQDILDLKKAGAIKIRDVRGRKKIVRRKNRRRIGKIKKKVNRRKQEYVKITRKLRKFAKHLLKTASISREKYREIRRLIRARKFKSKRHLKTSLQDGS